MNEQAPGAGDAGSAGPGAPTSAASILAAAEQLAAEITRNAQTEADAIRARAGHDSDVAGAALTDRLQRLSTLTDVILENVREMRTELDSLSGSLSTSESEGVPPAVAIPEPDRVRPVAIAHQPEPAAVSDSGLDDAGARLIALNLALSETPRDEAVRQLRDQVPDAERLVAEVYASVDR